MIAVIATGGKQYVVKEGQSLKIEKLPEASRSKDTVTFKDVLLVAENDSVSVGTPTVSGATVQATIVGDGKGKKIRIVKYKAKVRYRRATGHRQPFTEVKISKISAK